MKAFLIIILVFVMFINIIMLFARKKLAHYLKKYLGTTDLKEAIELSEIQNQNTPKSLSGMEVICLPLIEKDFPDLNINELKRQAEASIISYFECLEAKEYKDITNASENIKTYITSRISDIGKDENVKYDSIKIHRTIINKYEKKDGIATICFQTALEYMYSKNDGNLKKIQDRIETEFIYIIDRNKVNIKAKGIGLNCPNCGAPIKSVGDKTCEYCGTGVVDIVKRTWYLNNIKNI